MHAWRKTSQPQTSRSHSWTNRKRTPAACYGSRTCAVTQASADPQSMIWSLDRSFLVGSSSPHTRLAGWNLRYSRGSMSEFKRHGYRKPWLEHRRVVRTPGAGGTESRVSSPDTENKSMPARAWIWISASERNVRLATCHVSGE